MRRRLAIRFLVLAAILAASFGSAIPHASALPDVIPATIEVDCSLHFSVSLYSPLDIDPLGSRSRSGVLNCGEGNLDTKCAATWVDSSPSTNDCTLGGWITFGAHPESGRGPWCGHAGGYTVETTLAGLSSQFTVNWVHRVDGNVLSLSGSMSDSSDRYGLFGDLLFYPAGKDPVTNPGSVACYGGDTFFRVTGTIVAVPV